MTRLLAGLTLLIASGCTDPHLVVKIPFTATWGGDPITCKHGDASISDMRFYLSSVQLLYRDGKAYDLALHSDLPWQQSDLALIEQGEYAGDGRLSPYKSEFVRGFNISDEQREALVAFLEALTDATVLTDARFSNPHPN